MNYPKTFGKLTAVAAFMTVFSAPVFADSSVQFMDLQWLKPGVTAEQAGGYFNSKLEPIVRKHGGSVVLVYRVDSTMKGEVKPAIIASMKFPSKEEMQALFKDAEYQKIIPLRDATFDIPQMSLFQVTPLVAE